MCELWRHHSLHWWCSTSSRETKSPAAKASTLIEVLSLVLTIVTWISTKSAIFCWISKRFAKQRFIFSLKVMTPLPNIWTVPNVGVLQLLQRLLQGSQRLGLPGAVFKQGSAIFKTFLYETNFFGTFEFERIVKVKISFHSLFYIHELFILPL